MNTNFNFRMAQISDIPEIIQLSKEHAQFEQSNYIFNHQKEKLEQFLFGETSCFYCLLIELDEKTVGYATFMRQFSTWNADFYLYLDCLYLRPNARRLGIGKNVMHYIQTFAKNNNCTHIEWQTPDFNQKAISFYKKLGAIPKSKERFIWE